MKKLLALKGINSVSYIDIDKIEHTFAYTHDMLANFIFIEQYEVKYFEEERCEEENLDEYKTVIDVFMVNESKCYEYTILLDANPYIPPAYLFGIIVNTVEVIKNSDPQSLANNLKELAMATVCAEDYTVGRLRDEYNERVRQRIQKVLALVEQNGKADGMHKPITQKVAN